MCGIFGTINSNKPKRFKYTAFAGLGIINDSRGGDSCGVFIDGKYEYGTYTEKLFKNFMLKSKVLEEFRGKDVSIAIGHCRKASVGAVNEANAQPVILKDENGNPEFVLIHNGTIKNYGELAKKYIPETDIKDMTDSQIMARIFYKAGYNVLSEYYGGGVFFIVDYRSGKPVCKFFQGYSKPTEYSKDLVQERPFYFSYRDGTLIFSSIYEMLMAACPGATLFEPSENVLYSYSEHGLVVEGKYPRDKVAQQLPYKATTTTATAVYTAGKSLTEKIEDRLNPKPAATTTTTTPATATTTTATKSTTTTPPLEKVEFNTKKLVVPKPAKDQVRTNSMLANRRIEYDYKTSRYVVDRIPLHGGYAVGSYGTIIDENSSIGGRVIWFFDGIPFIKKGDYFYNVFRSICMDLGYTPSQFTSKFTDIIRWYSSDRIYRDAVTNVLMVASKPNEHKPYTGVFMRLCDLYGSNYVNGIETVHNVTGKDSINRSFLNNENQGGTNINTESSILKTIKRLCQEAKRS